MQDNDDDDYDRDDTWPITWLLIAIVLVAGAFWYFAITCWMSHEL